MLELLIDQSKLDLIGVDASGYSARDVVEAVGDMLERVELLHFKDGIVAAPEDRTQKL